MRHSATTKIYPHTICLIPTSSNIQICSGLDLPRTEARDQGHRYPKTVGDTPRPNYVSTYMYHGSSMSYNIEDMRRISEVEVVKVTVTQN